MNYITLVISIIIAVKYSIESILDRLNASKFEAPIPESVSDVYNAEEYQKSVRYKLVNYRFSRLESTLGVGIMLLFLWLGGFAWVDNWARSISENEIVVALLFFGVLGIGSDLLGLPFSYYHTFVIEERFGFNKQTLTLFWTDKIKSWLLAGLVGSGLLWVVMLIYQQFDDNFWWYAWLVIIGFTLFMNLFYARLLVPLFNKQTPLEAGSLRDKIEDYAHRVGFSLKNIYVIDGSKRSTKANAYFSGFGREKRITLYDTLIDSLSEDEIVAVLAHEVGHYKKKTSNRPDGNEHHNHWVYPLYFVCLPEICGIFRSPRHKSAILSCRIGKFQPFVQSNQYVYGILRKPIVQKI